jgi:hypothetical protein
MFGITDDYQEALQDLQKMRQALRAVHDCLKNPARRHKVPCHGEAQPPDWRETAIAVNGIVEKALDVPEDQKIKFRR